MLVSQVQNILEADVPPTPNANEKSSHKQQSAHFLYKARDSEGIILL